MQKFQVSTYVYNIMHNYIDNRGDLGLPLQLQMFCTTRNKVRDSEHCDDWLMMRGNCHTSSFNKEKRYLDLRPFINYQKKKSVVCQFVNSEYEATIGFIYLQLFLIESNHKIAKTHFAPAVKFRSLTLFLFPSRPMQWSALGQGRPSSRGVLAELL